MVSSGRNFGRSILTLSTRLFPCPCAPFVRLCTCIVDQTSASYTPAPPKVEWGFGGMVYFGFTPMSVRPSVRPSVDKVSGTFLKKTISSIHSYLVFTLMGWVFWPLFIFVFLASLSAHPVAKYLAENGVSGTFWKKLLALFISYLAFTLMGWVSWPLYIFVFLASFLKNSHLCSTRLQNRNLYWIFLDEVGNDQNGSILSPFMDTACYHTNLLHFPIGVVLKSNGNTLDHKHMQQAVQMRSMWGSKHVLCIVIFAVTVKSLI